MKLKEYQSETLAVLRRFFEEARVAGPRNAYEAITRAPEQAGRLGRYAGAYTSLDRLPEVPYICLRLPTGGGKTILAAHAVAIARDAWIEKDHPLVLWLVPSNTIRIQTVQALKNTRHPYRQALDESFSGRVRVFDITDFSHVRPPDLRDHCCIVVGTIQTLRVTNTEGRKVYAHNENLEPHFASVPETAPGLEKLQGGGGIKLSFANLLHLHRPLMIVDEAHNAVTGLTREMQARVNPCAIVEFTATPRDRKGRRLNNILHSVSARELKTEAMIKLPIQLSEHDTWQGAVSGAIAARAALARSARDDADYIRPLVLFQAQPKNQEVTVDALKTHLVEVEGVAPARIAVATGDQRELDGIDLFDRACAIEHVITIEALKEGWDCSFAYVFCSVARIRSAVDVEQLLGRVLRMPYAARRRLPDLNRAYAFVSEPSFGASAQALADKLVAMGFEEDEAHESIELEELDLGGWGDPTDRDKEAAPSFRHTFAGGAPEVAAALEALGRSGVTVHEFDDGAVEVVVVGRVGSDLEEAILEAVPESERPDFAKAVAKHRINLRDQPASPADQGEELRVPRLMSAVQGKLELADTDLFMESHEWSLLDHSPRMDGSELAIRETARSFEIDLDGNRIAYQFASEEEQLALNVEVEGWTPEALVRWLDRQVRDADIRQGELIRWLRDLVGHLIGARKIHVSALMRGKFLLARKIRDKLAVIRRAEREAIYQRCLFAPAARVEVSFDHAFEFHKDMYRDRRRYRGRWRPRRHFLGADRVPVFDGVEDGEELRCAQAIDSLPGLRYWIRNVARDPASFSLPVVAGRFYPDFVARLDDGRLLVVEYKGAHIAEGADTAEKRTIGELWERESAGTCLFVMAEKDVGGKDARRQLMEKTGIWYG